MEAIVSSAQRILEFQKDTIRDNIASIQSSLHSNETLNIETNPVPTKITSKLYKKIAFVCHPDRNSSSHLTEAFKELAKDSSITELFDFISKNNIDIDTSRLNYTEAFKELFENLELIAKNVNNPFFKWGIMDDDEKQKYLNNLRKS